MTSTSSSKAVEAVPPVKAPTRPRRAVTAKKATPVKAKPVTAKKATSTATKKSASAKVLKTPAPVTPTPAPTKAKSKKEMAATPAGKDKKVKVVRDSFTIPKNEFSQLGEMKKKALALGLEIKKSELIRAGLMLLNSATEAAFKKALVAVPTLKTGRPGKN